MLSSSPNYVGRRLVAVVLLVTLAAVAGSVWGYWLGYNQGKQDVMKQVEQRLNPAPAVTPAQGKTE